MVKSGARFTLVDLSSDIPPCRRHLVDKSGTMSSKFDIWSAFGSC